MTRQIISSRGAVILIDEADWPIVQPYRWWVLAKHGYAFTRVIKNGKPANLLLHRLITDAPKGAIVDHTNGNRLDNRRTNLRLVSPLISTLNRHHPKISASGIPGVHRHGRRWRAVGSEGDRIVHLGSFASIEDARQARTAWERQNFPPVALPNRSFPHIES